MNGKSDPKLAEEMASKLVDEFLNETNSNDETWTSDEHLYDVVLEALLDFGKLERKRALLEAAKVARNPYSDAVQAIAGDEPGAVGEKIAKALLSREDG
jgi:hypothetical protein